MTTRDWLIAALAIINVIALSRAVYFVATWPDEAEVSLSSSEVEVTYDSSDNPQYYARIPLKIFPYDVALFQYRRFELLWLASINLLLLSALIYSHWKWSQGKLII